MKIRETSFEVDDVLLICEAEWCLQSGYQSKSDL